jgi:hypothetical protein
MIRHRQGNDFLLITQDDHARLSGRFAELIGNGPFTPPSPRDEVIRGASLHDCGWPLHDDQPTLNLKGEPLHVLESPMAIATRVWTESARRAHEEAGPYAGLLVSIHVFTLSASAKKDDGMPHERAHSREEHFLLNQFQQAQIEHQEDLRRQLGLRTDRPLKLGLLAKRGIDEQEDRLSCNYAWVKAMDAISLDLCCSENLFPKLDWVQPRPGAEPVTIRVEHPGEGLALDPWPFNVDRIERKVPCRRVPARAYASEAEFREIYAAAPREQFTVRVRPAHTGTGPLFPSPGTPGEV